MVLAGAPEESLGFVALGKDVGGQLSEPVPSHSRIPQQPPFWDRAIPFESISLGESNYPPPGVPHTPPYKELAA